MKKFIIAFLYLASSIATYAQYQAERYDTSYYVSYRDKLTLGPLLAKKNTAFKMNASESNALRYFSNNPSRIGLYANHDFLALSGTIGVGRLDPSSSKDKGKTKPLNLQLSFTGRKVLADIYIQRYKGLYANITHADIGNSGKYYVRPDIATSLYGTTITIIDNNRRFTAQAPFLLDSRQKKSAGSLLYGGEIYYGNATGDSAFIPSQQAEDYPPSDIHKIHFITIGPGVGYGYTFVTKQYLFLTGMLSLNGDISYITEHNLNNEKHTGWKFNPNLKMKAAAGYNTEKWGISLSYVSNRIFFTSKEIDARYLNYNDNYKLMYVRRINAGKTIPKITGFAKNIINKVGLGFLVN